MNKHIKVNNFIAICATAWVVAVALGTSVTVNGFNATSAGVQAGITESLSSLPGAVDIAHLFVRDADRDAFDRDAERDAR